MAEDKKKDKDEEGEEAAAKPKSKKKLIIIIAVVLVLILGGVGFMLMGKPKASAHPEDDKKDEKKVYATFEMETVIVNLSENASFLKTKILVEYDPEVIAAAGGHGAGGGHGYGGGGAGGEEKEGKSGGPPPLIQERMPMVKDAVIRVLSSKRADEVLSPDGKEHLKEELVEAINEAIGLDEGAVVNIYFLEFIVQ